MVVAVCPRMGLEDQHRARKDFIFLLLWDSAVWAGESMRKPRLLDLFCCAGGAGKGYHLAGFDVVGVDIERQPRYPFEFYQADAMEFPLAGFDVVHASPPCQSYSRAMRHLAKAQPMLIDAVRARLARVPVWVIENVEGAPMVTSSTMFGAHGAMVCGSGLGLKVYRHRLFESNVPLVGTPCRHAAHAMNPHNQAGRNRIYRDYGRSDPEVVWREEMGVGWMNRQEGREAIPPAYTEHIGRQLLAALSVRQIA